jgi:phospholipase C
MLIRASVALCLRLYGAQMRHIVNREKPFADSPTGEKLDSVTRRRFLQLSGAVAATATGPLLTGRVSGKSSPVANDRVTPLNRFDHLIVVMFENRSFDNLLGYLYESSEVPGGQSFDGVARQVLTNPVPGFVGDGHDIVRLRRGDSMDDPNPDPGEEYPHINTQLFGQVNPEVNRFAAVANMQAPYNAPPDACQPPAMKGFVADYIDTFQATQGRMPTYHEYRVIMDCFGPESVPVLSALARGFAVYDAWFCAVPSQTFCNRSFFHASTSAGFVVNVPYLRWLDQNSTPTIFNRLEDASIPWRVYFDQSQIVSLTGLIHAPALRPYWRTNFATMDDFYDDVTTGRLPAYSFVEPRMIFDHNDMHPPVASLVLDGQPIGATSDVRAGEQLLHNIYESVRTSTAQVSNAMNTMLLITFDEHGGTYDHVSPPTATPPQPGSPAGEMGFRFDRLGVRVPTVAISAFTRAGSIISRPVHHAAVIRTLIEKYELGEPLTARDAGAPDLSDALNLSSPRDPGDWPVTTPRPVPEVPSAIDPALAATPLSGLEVHTLGLLIAAVSDREPELPSSMTVGEGLDILYSFGRKLFGGS